MAGDHNSKTMTEQEAIAIIEQMRRRFSGNGDEHDAIRRAIETIVAALKEKEKA